MKKQILKQVSRGLVVSKIYSIPIEPEANGSWPSRVSHWANLTLTFFTKLNTLKSRVLDKLEINLKKNFLFDSFKFLDKNLSEKVNPNQLN